MEVRSSNAGQIQTVGAPYKPGHPFYEKAKSFRDCLRLLGIKAGAPVEEFAESVTPELRRLARRHNDNGLKVQVVSLLLVTHKDGRQELLGKVPRLPRAPRTGRKTFSNGARAAAKHASTRNGKR